MTTHEAATIAGVTPTTIRRWIGANPQRLVAGTKRLPHTSSILIRAEQSHTAPAVVMRRPVASPVMNSANERRPMNTNEAAAAAGRTKTTIRNWIARGRLEASIKQTSGPPGFAWDITPEALAVAIAAQRRPGRPYKTAPKAQTAELQTEESKPC